ncbi:MAG: twin-arginine translocase TatA/TatE family subunit [Solirubrobacterales bacterium]|nr:twin-arginine translocase TatA/TatE family subunit [Solirubrobacterales bacterium]
MPNVGPLEIAIVLIIALIVFGPKRLPELGKSLGKGINEFRDGLNKVSDDDDDDDDDDDEPDEKETAALTPPPAEPQVTEIIKDENQKAAAEAEPVESEVVPERKE